MNFSATFIRRLHWLNLPGAFLIALLQRTPILRVASTAGEITRASPVGAVLRAAVATAASLGALHSLAGATTLSVSSGAATGVSGKVGAQLGPIAMGTIGTLAQPLSWGISGTIPAGLRFLSSSGASLTAAGTLNTPNGVMLLTGTPTAPAGIYALTLVAYQGVNRTLIASPTYTYSIVITGGVVAATSITTQPASLVMVSGSTAVFSVVATGAPTYQWLKYGVALPGATNRTLVVTATAETVGSYSVVVTDALESGTSASATLSLATTAENSRLINLSILTNISAADPDFTMGTVLGGTGTSGNKPLLVRAVGPSLGALGVLDTLDDPKLEMFAGAATFATNDNWGGGAALSNAFVQVGAFAYTAGNSRDAALLNAATPPRDYTVRVSSGVAGASGAVIAELYDATPASAFTATTARLINVSVRKQIDAGATLTAGFVIGPSGGTVARTVLVRAIGPGLGVFGVPGTMPDPKLELFSGANVIAASDNWGGDASLTAAGKAVGAFAIADLQSKDAMILVTLAPGNYTAQVTGSGSGGVALVEVYEVP
ncbi:MAG: immunoglobulin domain-containing protein [Verrucomicrobia bacterium]|nr:immunoglobulin domain-containing protein [Verrucomicrobiota bacterium]